MTVNVDGRCNSVTMAIGPWLPLLAAWIVAMCPSGAVADTTKTTPFPDIQTILDRGTLRVAMLAQDIPPFVMTTENGTPNGIDVRIAKGLADRLGVDVDFLRTAKTTDALIKQAAGGQVDMAISFISRTVDRSLLVRFSRPYVTEHIALALNRRLALKNRVDCPDSPDGLASLATGDWKIGAQRGTIFEKALRDMGLEKSMTLFDDIGAMLSAVESGTHLGGLGGEVAIRYAMNVKPALRIRIELCTVGDQKDNIAVAVRPDAPNLKDFIDIAFDNAAIKLDAHGALYVDTDWGL